LVIEHDPEKWKLVSEPDHAQGKDGRMPKITYIDQDGTERTVDAELGATVMETAINNDVPGILATCGGSCSCATCHVYVDEDWFDKLPPLSLEELDMLDTAHDLEPNSRLSCQILVTEEIDGLVVKTPARQI
jgi:2Fe-2S ferredoxin